MKPRNEELFARAQARIPAGVNSPVRAFRAVGGTPPFFERASGAHLWDADEGFWSRVTFIGQQSAFLPCLRQAQSL